MPTTSPDQLAARYERIADQLRGLFVKTVDPIARMASTVAVLHHKLPHFFWTGFYRLQDDDDDELMVGPYQGPLACAVLPGPDGVCWAAVTSGEPIIVPDVHAYAGHVACDGHSQSEIVVPVRNADGQIVAVLDVDSDQPGAFSETDVEGLVAIAALIHEGERTRIRRPTRTRGPRGEFHAHR